MRALDLFCCSGGTTRGLQRAGFHVTGVDKVARPRYIGDDFVQADAFEFLTENLAILSIEFDLIVAGPPCQKGSALTVGTNASRGWGHQADVVQRIPELRVLLDLTGLPHVIEQPVGDAPIRKDLRLCMDMFKGDREPPYVWRHRWFEISGFTVEEPTHPKHVGRTRGWRHSRYFEGDYVAAYGNGGGKATVPEMRHAMGIDWTDVREELTEAIPPAYFEYIGREFLKSGKELIRR